MIERIFHPIGQGAFYSERHDNFNIVYDCGNWRNTKLADKVVKQAFLKDEVIDILFISHFDYDHVNKIKTLKEHTKIKKVVMPLLHDNEKHLLLNFYRVLGFNILTLISNPQEFFGKDTQIISVNPTENNETPLNDDIDPQNIDTLTTTSIQSGSILSKNFNSYDWIFIPFNYEYKLRNNKLEKLLKIEGFDVDKLKTDTNYTLDEIINDVGISKVKGGKIFRKIYDMMDGGINQNSMLLYSGLNCVRKDCAKSIFSFDYSGRYFKCLENFHHIRWHRMAREEYRVSCIYTGDTDLNIVKIKSIFRNFWKSVGTIQIPHHGDIKSFDKSVLDDKYYWCPISVGKTNTYGHPSCTLVSKILNQESCPILVTENLSSGFIEHIRC